MNNDSVSLPIRQTTIVSDLNSVRDYYNNLIKRRGFFIFLAGTLFALGLFSLAIIMIFAQNVAPAATVISAQLTGSGKDLKLVGKVQFEGLPRNALAETEIIGFEKTTSGEEKKVTLFRDLSHADSTGKLSVSAELQQLIGKEAFKIQAKIKSGDKSIPEENIELRR